VELPGMALMAPATMLTTQWVARLAHATAARLLRRQFALFLALMSARVFCRLRTAA